MRIVPFVLVLASAGCAGDRSAPPEYAKEAAAPSEAPAAAPAPAPPASRTSSAAAARGGAAAPGGRKSDEAGLLADKSADVDGKGGEGTSGEPAAPQPVKRMVHYNGYAKLKVTSPRETMAQATKLGEEAGGYVESLAETYVTLRVPVTEFRRVYSALLKLGDVMERSMTAQDVTDAFTAMELRLKTLKASRDRLIALLGRARDEDEKLSLLREIRRLSEEVDQLDMQLRTVAHLASFSRLSLELVPRQSHETSQSVEDLAAFQWIRRLSPFRRDVAQEASHLKLNAPEGMVILDDDSLWIAESADGAVIWASERDNEPAGTADFWLAAITARLGPEYAAAEPLTIGEFKVLRLVDQSENAYRYLVGVRVVKDDLQVIEVYYPTAEHESRYIDAVRKAIEGGEV